MAHAREEKAWQRAYAPSNHAQRGGWTHGIDRASSAPAGLIAQHPQRNPGNVVRSRPRIGRQGQCHQNPRPILSPGHFHRPRRGNPRDDDDRSGQPGREMIEGWPVLDAETVKGATLTKKPGLACGNSRAISTERANMSRGRGHDTDNA